MSNNKATPRISIIGAGPGGLAAAMLLAHAGADVVIHERLDRVGGRSATIVADSDVGQFRFDMGPTFFLYPRVLEDVFRSCGMNLADEVEMVRLDPQYRLSFESGGQIDSTSDPERLAAEVARFSPEDALALPRFMADNRRKLEAFRPVFENEFESPFALLRPDMLRALPLLRPHRTLDGDLSSYFSNPLIRLAFSFQSKYLGMSPFKCPSLFSILAFMEYEFGVWHPTGGCGAVMVAMARAARRLGVSIELGAPVEKILFDGRRATGVRVGGVDRPCDAVVVNADFAHSMKSLVPDALRRRWTDKKIDRKEYSCSTFMLYLGIEGNLPDIAHHTIHLSRDYRRNIAEIEAGGPPPSEPSFYVQNASVTDSTLAPAGHSTVYVLVPVGNNGNGKTATQYDWATQQESYRNLTLDRLAQIGIPDIRQRIRYEKVLTPVGWEQDMSIHRGATFNLAHSINQMLHMRPRNRFEDLGGVYLVGGGTHPGSGLPVIFESARITSRLLAEDLGLQPDWNISMSMPADRESELMAAQ